MNLHRTLDRIDRALLRKYNFVLNFAYYVRYGYPLRRAWQLARDTL